MINWYIVSSETKSESYLNNVTRTVTPFMDYFCSKISEIDNCTLDNLHNIFIDIVDGLPIMKAYVYKNEFIIFYNKTTQIKFRDTTKQIYRDIKLEKILK